jgi:hypothetical protein
MAEGYAEGCTMHIWHLKLCTTLSSAFTALVPSS